MKELSFERRIQLLSVAAGLPGSLIALILLWTGDYSSRTAWTLTIFLVLFWLAFALSVRHRVVFSLQTLSNLLAALREEDFSIRARGARYNDALGEVMREVNALSETLREQRLGALEATALLRTVMEEIDVAIFTFDAKGKLRLINRAGERLLARPAERLLGLSAADLGLAACLEGEPERTIEANFPGGTGRWAMRRGSFRQGGLPQPKLAPVAVSDWIHRVARLETRLPPKVVEGPSLTIQADVDQLEQLLINLIHNAEDASLATCGAVEVRWSKNGSHLDVSVLDEGPGLPNTTNLFVPFFTTKPGGSGIGLVLSRQIAEAHGGELILENRRDKRGCEARLRLPLS